MPTEVKYLILGDSWSALGAKIGKPFTGSSETLLKATLKEAKIPLEECAFDNATPQPLGNSNSKAHVDLHREQLRDRIKEMQPKVILACGSWATYAVLSKQAPIEEIRGRIFWSVDLQCYIIPTYNPKYINYKPTVFNDFANDILKLKIAAKKEPGELVKEKPCTVTISSIEQYKILKHTLTHPIDNVIAVDIETEGFDFFKDAVLSIGIGVDDKNVYIFNREMCESPEMQSELNEILSLPNVTYVYQNGKFDVKFLRANPDPKIFGYQKKCVIPDCRCDFDTMLAHYCCDERQGTHGLKMWAREEFDAPDWEADIEKYLPKKDTPYSAIPEDVLHKYQGYDVFYTRKGYYLFTEKMKEEDTYRCFKQVYVPAVEAFTEIELEGIPINRTELVQLYNEAQPRIAEAAKRLVDEAVKVGWSPEAYADAKDKEKLEKWTKENQFLKPEQQAKRPAPTAMPKEFNPKSHPQLSWVAYDLCGMPLFEGSKTCNKDAVDAYRHKHPFWEALANYKEVSDLFGTFIKGMLERIDKDDHIRPDFLLHGTKTGRISCTNPNMQNLPRGSIVKDFFVADAGCVVCNADYKTLEVVIASILSGDENMQKPFIEHLDFHSETAKKVFGEQIAMLEEAEKAKDRKVFEDFCESTMMLEIRHHVHDLLDAGDFEGAYKTIWKHLRFLTKFITFGIMYGRGAQSLAEGELNCAINEATKYVNMFFEGYPKYSEWLKTQNKSAVENGYVQNIFGFKRRWALITADNLHEIRNQSWNTPVQGSASMVCMQALCRIQKGLKERGWGRVLFTVHDSIVTSLSKAHLQEAMTLVHDEMVKDIIGTNVQLEAELEVGPSYKQVDEVHLKDGVWVAANPENDWLVKTLKEGK